MITLSASRSALVLIDLQQGIMALPSAPRPATEVLANGKILAERFRVVGAPVVLVTVGFAADFSDAAPGLVDQPAPRPAGGLPVDWSRLADGLEQPGDLRIHKQQWGAFSGTGLDQMMRRRGIDTLVVAGIATNFGVESTVRHGWELGYSMVVPEDACSTTTTAEAHEMTCRLILPRIARMTTVAALTVER